MRPILLLAVAPGCVLVTPRECADRKRDLWVRVVDAQGFPVEGATVTVGDGRPRDTDRSGEVLFREVEGRGPVAVASTTSDAWTAGGTVVDPDDVSVATLVLARRQHRVLRYPADGAAIVRDGVFALVFPPGSPAEVDYVWVEPGLAVGPPKVGPTGELLDLRALVELPEVGANGVVLRLEGPDDPDEVWQSYRFDPAAGWVVGPSPEAEGAYLATLVDAPGWWGVGPEAEVERGTVEADGRPISRAEVRTWTDARPGAWATDSDAEGRFDRPAVDGRVHASAWAQQGPGGARFTGDGGVSVGVTRQDDRDGDGAWTPEDCRDGDPAFHPGAKDPAHDCDGVDGVDADHDGAPEDTDCDDGDPTRHPAAAEACDGRDEDCDGVEDDVASAVPLGDGGECVACAPDGVLALEPKLYWRLAPPEPDAPDRVRDSSGFGRDGVLYGPVGWWPGVATWAEDAPDLSGDDDTIALDGELFGRPVQRFSVALWVRPQRYGRVLASYSTATALRDCQTDDPARGARALSLELVGDRLAVAVGDELFRSDEALPVDRWSHVVATFDLTLGKSKIYLDGRPTTVDFPPGRQGLPRDGRFVVGAALFDGSAGFEAERPTRFDGLADEVSVFDRVLSDEEVEALHALARCTSDPCVPGSDRACAVPACDDVLAAGAFAGTGAYWLLANERADDPEVVGTCFADPDGGVTQLLCGDGVATGDPAAQASGLTAPWLPEGWPGGEAETCDDGRVDGVDDTCTWCGLEPRDATGALFPHCQAVLDADPSARSGPYFLADPGGSGEPTLLRCRMEGTTGWTLVFFHDARSGVVFAPDSDADFLPDAADAAPDDPDPDGDGRLDGEEVLEGTDPLVSDFGRSGKPFFTVRPPQGSVSNESAFGPAYSILRHLGVFRGPTGFELSMGWPCADEDGDVPPRFDWRQTSVPTEPGPVDGFEALAGAPGSFGGLTLRSDVGHAYLGNPAADPAFLVGAYEAGLDPCTGWLRIQDDGDYCRAGTASAVELWVRPW